MGSRKTLICGWGVNDVDYVTEKKFYIDGKPKRLWQCPYFTDWKDMIWRCYNTKFHNNYPTYKDCTVCEEWRYLSNFIKWVDSQPNKDWQNCSLDKDILIHGNKIYSPDTCVYITKKLNSFLVSRTSARGSLMIGVELSPKNNNTRYFVARCKNPFTGKKEYLGTFMTELEAHLAWKAKKHEHACRWAELQKDERVSDRLKSMYSINTDLTQL